MNKKNVPKLVTGVVISLICIISLALSIYFSVLVTSTYKQAYWILGEVFNAFTFVGVGALIGVLKVPIRDFYSSCWLRAYADDCAGHLSCATHRKCICYKSID